MATELDVGAEKRKLLAEMRADLLKRQLSNAENYDRAILSLSTAFLGFSFAFLKDILPANQARWLWLLYVSWGGLTGSILATIVSFWVSQIAINVQLKKAEDYYLNDNQDALTRSLTAKAADWINFASGLLFVSGVILTTVFVITNFERSLVMSDKTKGNQVANESAPIPNIQSTPFERSAPIPNVQRVPQSQPPAQTTATPPAPPPNTTSSDGAKK